jgi:predicted glycoside hydrolase/deacetylase ChbG (UPF0249 family)
MENYVSNHQGTKTERRLIVTADDFGLTEKVNEAIVHAHRHGIVTSASLMVNAGAFESAVSIAKEAPDLDIGLHLNLTDKPFALAVHGGGAGMEREIRSQIEKALGTGLQVTHLDGHKHVHVIPSVLKILRRVVPEYGIRAIRTTVSRTPRLFSLLSRHRAARSAILKQYAFARGARFIWQLASGGAVRGPDYFYGIAETGFLDLETFAGIIQDLPSGTHELMCHPGYVDDLLRRTPTRLLTQRERELEMLTNREARHLIQHAGIELVSYRDLESYGSHRTNPLLDHCSSL